jgi:hypothetical protein
MHPGSDPAHPKVHHRQAPHPPSSDPVHVPHCPEPHPTRSEPAHILCTPPPSTLPAGSDPAHVHHCQEPHPCSDPAHVPHCPEPHPTAKKPRTFSVFHCPETRPSLRWTSESVNHRKRGNEPRRRRRARAARARGVQRCAARAGPGFQLPRHHLQGGRAARRVGARGAPPPGGQGARRDARCAAAARARGRSRRACRWRSETRSCGRCSSTAPSSGAPTRRQAAPLVLGAAASNLLTPPSCAGRS